MGVPDFYDMDNGENEPTTGSISTTENSKKFESQRSPFLLRNSLTPAATRVPRIKMNNGQEIPAFGLGTSNVNILQNKANAAISS